ncbi:MAG: InlB B-repeat-containing protein [Lachnospiraceae bacterium]|nr:InlB B-repeat-containing protein [Lachnospiraceae bacterium]
MPKAMCRAGRHLAAVFFLFWLLYGGSLTVLAGSLSAYTKYAGVSLSPDGMAFTTDAGVKTYESYPAGYTVYTGETAAADPKTGEHYYTDANVSEVRISKWVVSWADSQCIHAISDIGYYHAIQYAYITCGRRYAQGWVAYCADCGKRLTDMAIYMNSTTARGIRTLPGSAEYYYLCPWCHGLEQGSGYSHSCKRVSANRYTVRYAANAPSGASVKGTMANTGHMYGNASLFEGNSAAAAGYGSTSLRRNAYVCEGYVFTGWNTKANGSGTAYGDGAAVLNLTSVNGGTVTLYAQWEKEKSAEPEYEPDTVPEDETDPEVQDETDPEPESETDPAPESGTDPVPEEGMNPDPEPQNDEEETLTLTAWITHSRAGYSGDFKSGEGGVLYFRAEGYAERVEVIFPSGFTAVFPELNKSYVYEEPAQTQEGSISFSVPLYMTPGAYQITVKAYREEEEAQVFPVLVVSEESVLDELRTRIRNNQ